MSYIVDRSQEWRHVDGVVNATYTRPDETVFTKVKVRLGRRVAGDFATGIGGSVSAVPMVVWPYASDGATAVETLESGGQFAIGSVTYQIVTIDDVRSDGSQWKVTCKVHQ